MDNESFIYENLDKLEICKANCYVLLDPAKKMDWKLLVDFIDECNNDRIYLYSFIVNTCNIVEGL